MQKRLYILVILAFLSVTYGAFSIYTMLFNNRTPYTLECTGVLLDSRKVIAISNYKRQSKDTLFVNYNQSRVIMPNTLGYIIYDKLKKEFVLKNNACVFNPENRKPGNYFLPFAKTLNDRWFEKGTYFGSSEEINQDILIKKGIKYNSSVGTQENRVSIKLTKFGKEIVLETKDDGIGVKYPVKSGDNNIYEIAVNQTVTTNCPNVFLFDNATVTPSRYIVETNASTFSATYKIKNSNGDVIKDGSGDNLAFTAGGYLFSITPKYSRLFLIGYVVFFLCLIAFQIYFIKLYIKSLSPVIQSLFSIRILLNCIVMLAIPLFLTSYYMAAGRLWYLFLVLLLNGSFFMQKGFMHNINLGKDNKYIYLFTCFVKIYVSWIILFIIISVTILMIFYTRNESLFGIIPVLHIQQAIVLLLIYFSQGYIQKNHDNTYLADIILIASILVYTFIISLVTSDYGSLIYTIFAFILVGLVRRKIKIKTVLICAIGFIGIIYLTYNLFPDFWSHGKTYRIIAPYTSPESSSLSMANQASRESYSTLLLNLKNIVELKNPSFNNVIIPTNMRSTCHSDFAFHWSLTFGGFTFFILFTAVMLMLISNLTLLLFCSIRECRIGENKSFAFPLTREAELVRFLLAFTIISFIYPVASNLLLIPLTGQSIPCLSISNIEIMFLILLIVSLSRIFTNEKYINTNATTSYRYADVKMSMRYALFAVFGVFVFSFVLKAVSLYCSDDLLVWKKHLSDESVRLNEQMPDHADKAGLVKLGKKIIGNDNLTSIIKSKKPVLKNLASLYYFDKPYSETIYEPLVFSNGATKLISQMSIDSVFNTKSKTISGIHHPFGTVYAFSQKVNNKPVVKVTNSYYNSIPFDAQSINADLTAECSKALETHLRLIGIPGNIGSVMIVDNITGSVLCNSSFPLISKINSNEKYYFAGSLKKILIAYAALKIDPSYRTRLYGGKSFQEFLKYSDDYYSAALLKDLLQNHQSRLNQVLTNDFDLPLYSLTDDSYLDSMPDRKDYYSVLDRNNSIYRQSIGQQNPYKFSEIIKWYSRVSSGLKIELSYIKQDKKYSAQSLPDDERRYLMTSLNKVLYGTASVVRAELENNHIKINKIICKTGTAEKSDKQGNSSSSFILSFGKYTIGIMLKGTIPDNEQKLAAKDLFVSLIPVLKRYEILK